eukprot:COSAG06_NODE_69839_length_195_cov_66.937500_1_plen_60_part_01
MRGRKREFATANDYVLEYVSSMGGRPRACSLVLHAVLMHLSREGLRHFQWRDQHQTPDPQ